MKRYSSKIIEEVKRLRGRGKTYGEIRTNLKLLIPKSTLSEWCRNVNLPSNYSEKISKLNVSNLNKGRRIALIVNKIKKEEFFNKIKEGNKPIAQKIREKNIAKIALSMLCLGEASKYNPKTNTSFCLGNSDAKIIIIFLNLLRFCFDFDLEKIRCTVQCRADQDTCKLEKYWMKVTGIPKRLFYKPLIDPRTVGKPTKKKNYMGVLKVDYFDRKVQHDLESLASLIYNELC